MPSTYSPSLRIELIASGSQSGTWGVTTNNNLGSLIEQAIAGVTTVDVTAADVTLTSFNGTADQARSAVLIVNGSNVVTRNVIIPNDTKVYVVTNSTSQIVGIKTSGGTAFNCPAGTQTTLYCNGDNGVFGAAVSSTYNTFVDPTVTGGTFTAPSLSNPTVTGGTFTAPSLSNPTVTGGTFTTPSLSNPTVTTGTFAGGTFTTPSLGNPLITGIRETTTVSATAATGTINFDTLTQAVLYYTTNAAANWTVNVRGSSGETLNSIMSIGQSISITFMVPQGATAYYNNAFTVDGASVTPKWQGGTAPTSGNVSGIDVYTYAIVKTADATFTVFASQTKFA
jgi:hypothetical protein